MPLFKRKPYILVTPPSDLRPDESVFQVRHTKEIFREYEEYLSHVNLYRKRLWTCKVTGKQNLTYEEALISERRASEKIQHFPKEFMGPVLSMVQFSPLRIDELVDRIYKEFKDRFVLNEDALGKSQESVCACKILKVLQHANKEDYNYEVGWLDEQGVRFGVSTEPAANLTRRKYPFSRALLKAFIREASVSGPSRNSTWVVKSKLARKYRIPVEPQVPLHQEINRTNDHTVSEVVENGLRCNIGNRRKREECNSPQKRKISKKCITMSASSAVKKAKTIDDAELEKGPPADSKPTSKGRKTFEKDAALDGKASRPVKKIVKKALTPIVPLLVGPPPPPIKYPIEDSLVRPSPDDPVFTERPLPSTDFLLPMECLGSLLMVWDFCTSFSKALHLTPFTLEEFEKSLDYQEGNAPLIAEVFFALLRTNLSDPVLWEEFVKKRKRKTEVSLNTWKEDLSDLLQLTSHERLGSHLPSIRQGYYKQLDATVKLEILLDLVDRSLNSSIIRAQLDENIGEHQALSSKKREQDIEDFRRKKQEQLKQLSNGDPILGVGEANGRSRNHEHAEEANFSADDKDNGGPGPKSRSKDGISDEGDRKSIGWKTKGKRKSLGNHSPTSASGSLIKEEQAYLKENEVLQQDEKRVKKSREKKKILLDKRKGQTDARIECKTPEQIDLEMQKRQEHLDRELEKHSIRTSPLGKDRDHNIYWFFSREGRVFVENKDSTKWGYYSAKEEFEELLGSLNPKGVRERFLQKQLEKHYNKISNVVLRRSKEIAHKISMEEVAVRRSCRVRSAPRLPGFLTYVNKLRSS